MKKPILDSKEINSKELELRKLLARNEKERDRSQKWFFINLVAAIFFISLTLYLFPFLLHLISKWVLKSGKIADPLGVLRLKYLEGGIFFLGVADASLGLFWVIFRFRKGTDYRHKVHVLKEELDKLEKETNN